MANEKVFSEVDRDVCQIAAELQVMLKMSKYSAVKSEEHPAYHIHFYKFNLLKHRYEWACGCTIMMDEVATKSRETVVGYWFNRIRDMLDSEGD